MTTESPTPCSEPHSPELPPYRPPSEAESILIRVTRGCAWNRCGFCDMYKDLQFERREYDEIVRDIAAWKEMQPHAKSIFLADSDSLQHPQLVEIVAELRRVFPDVQRITSYTRLTTLGSKKPEALRALREAGLDRLHAGLESGSSRVRERIRKALPLENAIEGSRRAIEAGFELSLYILSGLGGENDWEEHGRESGRLVAQIWPHFLRLRSLVVLAGTPLMDEMQAGTFEPASPLTRLREIRTMLAELDPHTGATHDLELCSDHFTNVVWADRTRIYAGIDGRLPADKARLLAEVERAIEYAGTGETALDPSALARRGRIWDM